MSPVGVDLIFVVGGLGFFTIGILLVVRSRSSSRRASAFAARATLTWAQVIDLHPTWIRHQDGPDRVIYMPVVRFALPDGRVVESRTRWGTNPAPARVGDQVEVHYDPADPTRLDLAHRRGAGAMSCLMVGMGISFAVFGMVFVAIGYVVWRGVVSPVYVAHSWRALLGGLVRAVAPAVLFGVISGVIADRWWPGAVLAVASVALSWTSLRASWEQLVVSSDGIALSFPGRRTGSAYMTATMQRRFVAWPLLRRVEIDTAGRLVRVLLRADAPLPPWMSGRIIDTSDPDSGPVLQREVSAVDPVALQQAVMSASPGTPVVVG